MATLKSLCLSHIWWPIWPSFNNERWGGAVCCVVYAWSVIKRVFWCSLMFMSFKSRNFSICQATPKICMKAWKARSLTVTTRRWRLSSFRVSSDLRLILWFGLNQNHFYLKILCLFCHHTTPFRALQKASFMNPLSTRCLIFRLSRYFSSFSILLFHISNFITHGKSHKLMCFFI